MFVNFVHLFSKMILNRALITAHFHQNFHFLFLRMDGAFSELWDVSYIDSQAIFHGWNQFVVLWASLFA